MQADRTPIDLPLAGAGTTFIEASAGTGKTRTLTTLVARLVVEQGWRLDQILIVTFTRAATAELRDRIRRTLGDALAAAKANAAAEPGSQQKAEGDSQAQELIAAWVRADGVDPGDAARRLEAALYDIDRAGICTIHGFCQRALADLAFESGFPFGFEVSGNDAEMVAGAVRDFWRRRLYPASTLLVRHAFESGFLPRELAEWTSRRWARVGTEGGDGADRRVGAEVRGGEPLPEPIEKREAAWQRVFEAARAGWERHGETFRADILDGKWLNRQRYRRKRVEGEIERLEALFAAAEPRLPAPEVAGRYGRERISEAVKGSFVLPEHPLFDAFDRLEEESEALRSAYDQWLRWARRELLAEVRESVRRRVRADRRLGYDDLLSELRNALAGPRGELLAARIRREYPCALIDEFQDTDPVQADIFARVYGGHGGSAAQEAEMTGAVRYAEPGPRTEAGGPCGGGLFAVGDPKQSIYRFRGADVYAYLAARRAAREHLTLAENWRSVPALVEAVNAVFAAPSPFVVPEIEYRPVAAARSGGNPLRFVPGGGDGAPLEFWLLPGADDGKHHTKESANRIVARATANEIARLLDLAARGEATIDGDPLTGADVAVLVRTRAQGRRVAEALRARGVRSAEIDDRSVFETDDAEQVERLLWALAEPGREARVRGALAGAVFGLDARALGALSDDEEAWSGWMERLAGWRADWEARGIGPVLLRLLEGEGGAERLLARPGGVRRLTNVRHLADLLQEAETRRRLAPAELAAWLSRCRFAESEGRGAGPDESIQLRLESDEQLVKILTVHAAKGLEFPIVFCPFAWDARAPGQGGARDAVYHLDETEDYQEVLDLDPDERAEALAWLEELSESVRLLYVALTRAKYRCVVAWGRVNGAEHAPLAWLLHRGTEPPPPTRPESGTARSATPEDPITALQAAAGRFTALSAEDWREEVQAFARRFPGRVSTTVREPDPDALRPPRLADDPPSTLAARTLDRPLRRIRQMTSYSALLAEARVAGVESAYGRPRSERDYAALDRPDHDQHETPPDPASEEVDRTSAESAAPSAFTFPRGPGAGSCLHRIFEKLDEPAAAESERPDLDELCRDALQDFGIADEWRPVARTMVERTRAVRLREPEGDGRGGTRSVEAAGGREITGPGGSEESGFRLCDPVRRLVELEFHFPVYGLDRTRLGARLAEYGYPDPFARPAPGLGEGAPPPGEPIRGFLRGFVDLVVEHDGRWFIIDYKSNWLGAAPRDYGPATLAEAMRESGYPLQYLLYLVALHRYLSTRLPGYDYERHVGGVFYLFVRGIDPAAGMRRGVYFDRPPAACLHALEDCFRGGDAP